MDAGRPDVDDPDEFTQGGPPNNTNVPPSSHCASANSSTNASTPFLAFQMMESLLEKLKLLDFEQGYCRRNRIKGFSRLHFAIPTNPGEQFNSFVGLAAWMISLSGGNIEAPQEFDDPNATIATILDSLRALVGQAPEFPPSKLKSGCGEPCIHVLDLLADAAVKAKRPNIYEAPQIPQKSEGDDEEGMSISMELTSTVDEDVASNPDENPDGWTIVEWTSSRGGCGGALDGQQSTSGIICDSDVGADLGDDDEVVIDLDGLNRPQAPKNGHHTKQSLPEASISEEVSFMDPNGPFAGLLTGFLNCRNLCVSETKPVCQAVSAAPLDASADPGDWQLEVERVLPQLRVAIRSEARDWRSHLEQMNHHREDIESRFKDSRGHLQRLQDDLARGLNKIGSREKFINSQVDRLLTEYRCANDRLSELKERYTQTSGGITDRSKILADLSDELERVKQEMDQRGSSMTDGSPVVRIKQAIQRLKAENVAMEIRTGVLEHTWLRMMLHAREESQKPLFARPTQGAAAASSGMMASRRGEVGCGETSFAF